MMRAHIQKKSNNIGLRISIQLVKQLKLRPRSPVTIKIDNNHIIIQSPKYDLDKMLEDITPKNQHHLIFEDKQT